MAFLTGAPCHQAAINQADGKPGSRLLIQLIDGEKEPVSLYQKDPPTMKVEYTRERDGALLRASLRPRLSASRRGAV